MHKGVRFLTLGIFLLTLLSNVAPISAFCSPMIVACAWPVPAICNNGRTCCSNDAQCTPVNASSVLCDGGIGVNTGIGCLRADNPQALIGQLLGWGIGVGGGIAFLLTVYAGFLITTAAGDPKRVQAGRELLMSALSGLILIVLSVLLLNFIGVSVLGLSNLGFNIP